MFDVLRELKQRRVSVVGGGIDFPSNFLSDGEDLRDDSLGIRELVLFDVR